MITLTDLIAVAMTILPFVAGWWFRGLFERKMRKNNKIDLSGKDWNNLN